MKEVFRILIPFTKHIHDLSLFWVIVSLFVLCSLKKICASGLTFYLLNDLSLFWVFKNPFCSLSINMLIKMARCMLLEANPGLERSFYPPLSPPNFQAYFGINKLNFVCSLSKLSSPSTPSTKLWLQWQYFTRYLRRTSLISLLRIPFSKTQMEPMPSPLENFLWPPIVPV